MFDDNMEVIECNKKIQRAALRTVRVLNLSDADFGFYLALSKSI
jgi:hypothetical protein